MIAHMNVWVVAYGAMMVCMQLLVLTPCESFQYHMRCNMRSYTGSNTHVASQLGYSTHMITHIGSMNNMVTKVNTRQRISHYGKVDSRLSMTKTEEELKTAFLPIESRKYRIGEKPASGVVLAKTNFIKEFTELVYSVLKRDNKITLPESLNLKLSNEAVKEAEEYREMVSGRVDASPVARLLYDVGCAFLDSFFDNRPIARFWFLETGNNIIVSFYL
jgi:hypothetical protein